MSKLDEFKTLLKASGQSVTKTRLSVFEALLGQAPLSMHQLVERVRVGDRASVYRSIELFEKLGVVQRLNTGWKYKLELSDKFSEHHHHLTCTNCSKTIDMNETDLEELIGKIAAHHNFTPSTHQIEIQGLCSECQTIRPTLGRS